MNRLPFLTANWSHLLVVNYEVDPTLLIKHVPRGTQLDSFNGKHYISLVAFMFEKNKLFGLIPTIPVSTFEEANLRFYIKREVPGKLKRAVAFIKEVVPSGIIAWTARTFYNEPYVKLPMGHQFTEDTVRYHWGHDGEFSLKGDLNSPPTQLKEGSFPQFILEHYWGYTPQKDSSTIEYEVEHPSWDYREIQNIEASKALTYFYGQDFVETLQQKPHSSFLAMGSPIKVHFPKKIRI